MLKNQSALYLFAAIIISAVISSCSKDHAVSFDQKLQTACYSYDVGKIFITKCAIAGCHNTQSADGAGGFDVTTWQNLFKGTNGGSAVVPYSADQSFLVNFVNTYSDLGIMQLPTMPNNGIPLSRDEVITIKNWINDGAPDCEGHRLTDNPDRQKFYITNQGCDLVSVWDADKKAIMRYIKVGGDPNITEAPHKVNISPDGKYWYVCFSANNRYFQKYRTSDDSFVAQVDISNGVVGSWNTFAFTPDSKWAYVIDFNSAGRVAVVNCETMTLSTGFFNPFDPGVVSPHGSAISPDGKSLYLTVQAGNGLYKMDISDPPHYDGIPLNFPTTGTSLPHEIAFSPDGTLYFVTCQGTGDVKIFKASNDIFLKSIPVATDPVEMSFSLTTNYLFVTCMAGNSVSIINYKDTTLVKTISNVGFAFPHGVAVDDVHGICYVSSRNTVGSGGPPPHHTSVCAGNNGFLNAIDLKTLNLVSGFKRELSVDPYTIAIRKSWQ